ncbi:hypothetical protein B5S27_g3267 [[Candida] boidinii]|nr:hypothetical protein B5S27_g3267 [[Candida] boidinii]
MASVFGRCKCLLTSLFLFYFLKEIIFTCPLNKELSTYDNNSFICEISHEYYSKIEPFTTPILDKLQPITDPIIDNISETLSPIAKPVSERLAIYYSILNNFYINNISPYVNKSIDLILINYNKFLAHHINSLKLNTTVYSKYYFNIAKNYILNEVFPIVRIHSIQFKYYIINSIIPNIKINSIKFYHFLKFNFKKSLIKFYYFYDFKIYPNLSRSYYFLKLNELEPYVTKFQNSTIYNYFRILLNSLINYIQFLIDFLKQDKLQQKFNEKYIEIENKKQFLKNEFNRIFDAGFNIPNYENIESLIKNKLIKKTTSEDSESTEETTSVDETTTPNSINETTSVDESASIIETLPPSTKTAKEVSPDIQKEDEYLALKYEKSLNGIISSALKDFNAEIKALEDTYLENIKSDIVPDLRDLGTAVNSGYENLHILIEDINRKNESESDSTVDSRPYKYVTRDDVQGELNKIREKINLKGELIHSKVKEYENQFSDDVLKIRKNILEILEEVTEKSLSEYSNEIIKLKANSKSEDNWEEWKNFNALKNEIFKSRDEILTLKPDYKLFSKALSDLINSLQVLTNDCESYLYILWAKGNIEFQARSQYESEATKTDSEEEEEETLTSTIHVYQTIMVNDDGDVVSTLQLSTESFEIDEAEETELAEAEPEVVPEVGPATAEKLIPQGEQEALVVDEPEPTPEPEVENVLSEKIEESVKTPQPAETPKPVETAEPVADETEFVEEDDDEQEGSQDSEYEEESEETIEEPESESTQSEESPIKQETTVLHI